MDFPPQGVTSVGNWNPSATETITNKTIDFNQNTLLNFPAVGGGVGGLASFNGGSTSYNIAHGLTSQPVRFAVTANSMDAIGPFYVTANATNLVVTYPIAPQTGTSNVKFVWRAGGIGTGGISTQNGGASSYTIPHELPSQPNSFNVSASSADAIGPFYVTADSLNLTIHYPVAVRTGSSNVVFAWTAYQ